MKLRKQDRIFSRLEGMEADPGSSRKEVGQNSPVSSQPHLQGEGNSTANPIPAPGAAGIFPIDDNSCPEEPAPAAPGAAAPAALIDNNEVPEPEPAGVGGAAAICGRTRAEVDIFASFDSSFLLVSPGAFVMGSPDFEMGRGSDEIEHEVTLTSRFYMQKTPVTQGLWKAVMGSNPSSFRDDGEELPVEGISWNECQGFLRKLNSIQDGKYRLPTEAEWEYACRAGGRTAFSDGEISEQHCGRDAVLWEIGWYCGNSGRKSRPVALKNPNAWRLHDMHGNVSEWCQDWYGEYQSGAQTDPRGPQSGPGKVVRGGSWFSNAKNCRSAARFHWPPSSRNDFIGFRLVREMP